MRVSSLVQRCILSKLVISPALSFNEWWAKSGDSSRFAYHLRRLKEIGLIHNIGGKYDLPPISGEEWRRRDEDHEEKYGGPLWR